VKQKSKQNYLIVFIHRQIANTCITQPEHYQFYCMHGGIEPAPDTFINFIAQGSIKVYSSY
jgi:hypothetical protein